MQITLLIGLPGSGKTISAKRIIGEISETIISKEVDENDDDIEAKKYIGNDSIILDDIRTVNDLPKPGAYEHIIITDVYLCLQDQRELALDYMLNYYYEYDPKIVMIFFENNPEKCSINSKHRDDPDVVLQHIKELADNYIIPEGAPIHEIWQPPKESPFQPFSFNGQLINIQLN